MDNQESWQRASLSTFEINKEGPYLNRDISATGTPNSYDEKLKSGYEEGLKQAQTTKQAVICVTFCKLANSLINPTIKFSSAICLGISITCSVSTCLLFLSTKPAHDPTNTTDQNKIQYKN